MKYLVLIVLVFSIACNDNSQDDDNNSVKQISGHFINWDSALGDSLVFRVTLNSMEKVISSTKIKSNGDFQISLPIPPTEILSNYKDESSTDTTFFVISNKLNFSNPNAKYIRAPLITHKIDC